MDATISSACTARRYPLRPIWVAVCFILLSSGLPPPVVADEQDLCNSDSRINCSQNNSESNHGGGRGPCSIRATCTCGRSHGRYSEHLFGLRRRLRYGMVTVASKVEDEVDGSNVIQRTRSWIINSNSTHVHLQKKLTWAAIDRDKYISPRVDSDDRYSLISRYTFDRVAILHKFMDDLQSLASLGTDEVADTLLGRIMADGDKDKDWSSATTSSSSGDEPPFLGFARRSAEYLRDDLGLDLMGAENIFRHDTTALGGDDSNSLLSSDLLTGTVYEAAHTMIEKWKDKCTPPEYTPSKDKLHEKMKVTGPVLTLTLDPIKCIVDNVNSVTCYPAALVMTTEPGSVEFPGKKSDLYWKDRDCPKDIKLTKMHKHVVIEAPTVHKFHQLHSGDDKEYTIKDVDDDKKHIGHHLH